MIKISSLYDKLIPFTTAITSLFIVTAYMYNKLYLGHYGIEVSKYFTLSDYLASSLEIIDYGFRSAIYSIISYLIFNNIPFKEQTNQQKKRVSTIYFAWFFIHVMFFEYNYLNPEAIYITVSLILYWYVMWSIFWLTKYFEERQLVLILLLFISLFIINVFGTLAQKINDIDMDMAKYADNQKIRFKENFDLNPSNLVLLGSNSNYYFFIGRNFKSYVVPRDKIELVTIPQ